MTPLSTSVWPRASSDCARVQLRLQGAQLRIERGDLEGDLVVLDDRDLLPGLDQVAFGDARVRPRAADAGARRNRSRASTRP